MASNSESTDRQVVPRWRPFREALITGELASESEAKGKAIDGSEFLKEKESAWLENKAIPFAVDLVSAATVLGKTDASCNAAEFIMENAGGASESARKLACELLHGKEPDILLTAQYSKMQIIQHAKELKAKRINQPRNAFVWVDLALMYVLLGQNDSARQALNVALALAPTDRFVLRCSARFLHHTDKHEEALQMLRRNSRTPHDPWLMAAEIAASSLAEKKSKFAKFGLEFLLETDIQPFHTSELASALASLEMHSGKDRKATKLFRESLKRPTNNALAQAVWASKRIGLGQINSIILKKAGANEALTLNEFNQGNWNKVIVGADKWAQEEGFSERPPLLSSFTASSFLDEGALAEAIAKRGLETNPGHPVLINNMAFAQILQGNSQSALLTLARVDSNALRKVDRICLLATRGLACFRLGNEEQGRKYYESAIEEAKAPEDEPRKIVATLYLAREEALRGKKQGFIDFKKAYEAAEKYQRTYLPALAEHLAKEVELAAGRAQVHFEIRKRRQSSLETGGLF